MLNNPIISMAQTQILNSTALLAEPYVTISRHTAPIVQSILQHS